MQLPDESGLLKSLSAELFQPLLPVNPVNCRGSVLEVGATLVQAEVPGVFQGELCIVGSDLKAEVVALKGDKVLLSPFGSTQGLVSGASVIPLGHSHRVGVGDALLGRVVDGFGQALDGGALVVNEFRSIYGAAPEPLSRSLIHEPLAMGVKAIDGLLTCGVGQRMGIFAAAGGGKSTLLGMIASHCEADIIVIGLVGERGREVREFLEYNLTPEARERTVTVVATSDKPALERLKAIYTATTIAEYYRDKGMDVLLMVDSLTRYARAAREIGLAAGEPAVAGGFPPSVFASLPSLLERAGPSSQGSITGIYTVLVEGDNLNEPVADEVRSILDGHIILSRKLAGAGHYPAIDINKSVSRVMNQVTDSEHQADAAKLRHFMALYDDIQFLVRVGEYQQGKDPDADEALIRYPGICEFLQQGVDKASDFAEMRQALAEVVRG